MDERVTDHDVVLEVEATAPGGWSRRRRIGGGIAAAVVLVGAVGGAVVLVDRSSGGDEVRAVETEAATPVSSVPTTSSTVAAPVPSTTEVPPVAVPSTSPPTVPRPRATAPVVADGGEQAPAELPEVTTTTVPSRFRVVPGPPLPVGTPFSSLVQGEVRLGPGGKTYGPTAMPGPGDTLDDVQPDFVALGVPGGATLCGYLPRGVGFVPPEGAPAYDVDGTTLVARWMPNLGCVPLDQLDELDELDPPAP